VFAHIYALLKVKTTIIPRSTECWVRDENRNSRPRSELLNISLDGDRRVCGIGGMMTGRGKPKNSEKNLLQCHFVHHEPHN
jgi:hypothetical protein